MTTFSKHTNIVYVSHYNYMTTFIKNTTDVQVCVTKHLFSLTMTTYR